jgi:hypothetical protein
MQHKAMKLGRPFPIMFWMLLSALTMRCSFLIKFKVEGSLDQSFLISAVVPQRF